MNKLEMAHEYVMNYMASPDCKDTTVSNIVSVAWSYADLMQDEADKREVGIAELMKDHVHDYIYGRVCACGAVNGVEKEWQPDWSQAPEWADWWYVTSKNNPKWCSKKPYQDGCNWFVGANETYSLHNAPSFNYQGNWKNSLRKRPQ